MRPFARLAPFARLSLLLCLLFGAIAVGCGGDEEIQPNPPSCPSGPPAVGAMCTDDNLSCHWEDQQAKRRTWCWCRASSWGCGEEPL